MVAKRGVVTAIAAMGVLACACGLGGFALGSYYQFRHNVFLHGATIGRDILLAKMCAQAGCDAVRDWVVADLPLQVSNYSAHYSVLQEPFPRGVVDVARNTWATRHLVDEAMKSPQEFQRAISDCKCGLHLQPAGQ
jgi:hypothetical protein